ncbi:transporter substrate-binding domain-containing protein [Cohnella thailandensis]|uniref:Transporter substrate-binding domain-containing protein n=1 Tax=Cohnella thailandensis TaxID=557557 RepID=A0A841SMU0_9BACL|nr:transporter substrate-binding domain-containing protein [Cohnella thailandensis]MBB6633783.1 transporter substrate-binding domain-containing protein [Cohnella thailandensis]MBP1976574.1 L-cystine transport system substrate-binding protein [Cohnella thailandensis]
MKKSLSVLTAAIGLAVVMGGCGNNSSNNASGASQAPATESAPASSSAAGGTAEVSPSASAESSAPAEVKKIIVGTGTQFPKVAFLDESGKLTGFDVELVREIDNRLPEYEFELQTYDFSNLLLSLETKKIDFIAHEMEKNPEREAKYLFNKEPYAHWQNKILVAKDNDSIQTLDDLKGKKVIVGATSAEAQIVENYNKEHDNAIKIVYSGSGSADYVTQISSGRVDATIGPDFTLPLIDPEGKLKSVGDHLSAADILFVFRKDDPEEQTLADAIDEAIKEIKADGTLSKLSTEWLGADFTQDIK